MNRFCAVSATQSVSGKSKLLDRFVTDRWRAVVLLIGDDAGSPLYGPLKDTRDKTQIGKVAPKAADEALDSCRKNQSDRPPVATAE